jgi:hypothetical protein
MILLLPRFAGLPSACVATRPFTCCGVWLFDGPLTSRESSSGKDDKTRCAPSGSGGMSGGFVGGAVTAPASQRTQVGGRRYSAARFDRSQAVAGAQEISRGSGCSDPVTSAQNHLRSAGACDSHACCIECSNDRTTGRCRAVGGSPGSVEDRRRTDFRRTGVPAAYAAENALASLRLWRALPMERG